MKEIIALQEYTDKYISLYEGEIRNIEDNLADRLISKGVVALHDEDKQFVETDPTVPEWAKASTKPTYTANEISYNSNTTVAQRIDNISTKIPSNLSNGSEDSLQQKGATSTSHFGGAFGIEAKASGLCSFAIGQGAEATPKSPYGSYDSSIAIGDGSRSYGSHSIALMGAMAKGYNSCIGGWDTQSNDTAEASFGYGTGLLIKTGHSCVIGRYNIADTPVGQDKDFYYYNDGAYAFIIGNGRNENQKITRSNAFSVKWDGTLVFANGTEITPDQFTQLLALLPAKD